MADVKISALPLATTPLAGTEVLPIVQSATTDQVSVANLTAGRAVSAASLTLTTTPLAVGSGGTGTGTAFTAGSVVFAGTSGVYSQNNSQLFWNNSLNRLGIGTGSPGATLDIQQSASTQLKISRTGNNAVFTLFMGSTDTYLSATNTSAALIFATQDVEKMRIDASANFLIGTTSSPTSGTQCLTIGTGTAATASPADTVTFYSTDRSAGNTIPSVYCEGSGVTNAGITSTTVTHKIAMRVNGTVYYLLATTNAT